MARLQLPDHPLHPGSLLAGTATLGDLRPGEEVEIVLTVSRCIHRPFSSEPASRWIAHEHVWQEQATAGGDGFAFAIRLPERGELEDIPWNGGRLQRFFVRLLRITVTRLEWELIVRPATRSGPVQEARERLLVIDEDGDDDARRGAA